MITARALGTYLYLATTGANISADDLSDFFPEGRKVFLNALKELRDLGLIETKRAVINGKYVTYSALVEIEFGSPKMELLSQQNMQNSILNIIAYLAKKQERVLDGVEYDNKINVNIGGSMSFLGQMDSDPDEVAERVRKDREKRQKEYLEHKDKVALERIESKKSKTPADWNPTDVSYEFATRVQSMWHVKPWSVAKTRFKIALSNARKEYGTDGEVENKMMDLYFMQIAHETKITDPEIIWKRFIMQFGNLATEARRSMVTPEDMATEKELARKSREKMKNV